MKYVIYSMYFAIFLIACQSPKSETQEKQEEVSLSIRYAKGFRVTKSEDYTRVEVLRPWPDAKEKFTYLFVTKGKKVPEGLQADAIIRTPVEKIVVTSTTHIPALEALGVEDKLIGFPETRYISSEKTRKNIDRGQLMELGNNETLNTELLISLEPDVLMGFAVNRSNKVYETLKKSGISVVYNGDWVEETPLGKAEWIKFFAPFFEEEAKADSVFNRIEKEYLNAKKMVAHVATRPEVMSGAMYKDVWYLPGGKSWAAQFLHDANADYLWQHTNATGSLSLSFESVLEKAQQADFWIAPAQFTTYEDLKNANGHYAQFEAFKQKRIYTFSLTKGATGGMLYYELAPSRPDMVLKDLIHIFHPEILPDHQPFFFKPLQ